MFTSVFSSVVGDLTIQNGLLCTGVSIVLGILIAVIYMNQGTYSKNFVVTLAMMPVLGTFGLIRFRSVPGTSREIANIFYAMAAGLATGMGYLSFAVIMTVIVGILFLILGKTAFGVRKNDEKDLRISGSRLRKIWIIQSFLKIFSRSILRGARWRE